MDATEAPPEYWDEFLKLTTARQTAIADAEKEFRAVYDAHQTHLAQIRQKCNDDITALQARYDVQKRRLHITNALGLF